MIDKLRLTTAKSSMIEALKELWRLAFGDADSYIDLFFAERFVPSQTAVALFGDRLAGMLFMLPATARSGHETYNAMYIYAVATHPDFRERGVSTALLNFTHELLAKAKTDFSVLVPAGEKLFSYYQKRGFKTEFYCRDEKYQADEGLSPQRLFAVHLEDRLPLRDRCFEGCGMYLRWDRAALRYQRLENELLGGETLSFLFPREGYALCRPADDCVIIKEWAAPEIYPDILGAIAAKYQKKYAVLRVAAEKQERGAYGFAMTKWYTTERKTRQGTAPYIALVLD